MKIKELGASVLGLLVFGVVIIGGALLFGLFVKGTLWVSGYVLPILNTVNGYLFLACLLVLVPLSFFRKTRSVPAVGFYIASYVFGLSIWLYGFVVTDVLWGPGALFVGLVLGLIGVVPIAMLACLFKSEWHVLAELAFGLVMTFGTRSLGIYLVSKVDRDAALRRQAETRSAELARQVQQLET